MLGISAVLKGVLYKFKKKWMENDLAVRVSFLKNCTEKLTATIPM